MKRPSTTCPALVQKSASAHLSLIYNQFGLVYAAQGRDEDAIREYDKAVAADGKFAIAWSNRAAAAYKMGDYHGAVRAADTAVRIAPKTAAAFRWRVRRTESWAGTRRPSWTTARPWTNSSNFCCRCSNRATSSLTAATRFSRTPSAARNTSRARGCFTSARAFRGGEEGARHGPASCPAVRPPRGRT